MFTMNAREYNDKVMNGLFRDIYPVIARQALDRTGIRTGLCIDLGGGPGMLGICIAQASDMAAIIVDPLADCLALAHENIARHRLVGRVTTRQGVAEALPAADGEADLIVSRGSIYFWEDHGKGLGEVDRALKPGGWAYIGGGFGGRELRDGIFSDKADDAEWNRQMAERKQKHPPDHFRSLLTAQGIPGVVESDDRGTWIVWRKPASGTPNRSTVADGNAMTPRLEEER